MTDLIIYFISVLFSIFALSGVNFDNFIKKNHALEARILFYLLSISLGYLVANFIINFLNISKIIVK